MTARHAAAVLAVVAVTLLVIAEFTTVFEVTVGSLEVVQRSVTAGDNHGYALLVVALASAAMTVLALRGAPAPAVGITVLGLVALAIALAVDLPDTRRTSGLPESVAYHDARARAGPGLALEIAGCCLLIVTGAGLLVDASAGVAAFKRRARGARAAG